MDITKIFKASVKAVRAKRKDLASPSDILPKAKRSPSKKSFHYSALEVVTSISKLRDFLLNYQLEYLGEFSHLISISSKMTSEERDEIDSDTQTFIKSCSSAINNLQQQVKIIKESDHYKSHAEAVVELLKIYLKDICKLYAKQKALRVKQAVDRNRMSRLQPEINQSKPKDISNQSTKIFSKENIAAKESSRLSSYTKENMDSSKRNKSEVTDTDNEKMPHSVEDFLTRDEEESKRLKANTNDILEISPAEAQMFEEENEQLYSELNNTVKEVKNIEGKVIEISQLQEIFQEKVMSQTAQIENIYETAVSTTENVKEGNEQIREAIKNSATFRVWILFFLVMCTFSLLFLDWYNY